MKTTINAMVKPVISASVVAAALFTSTLSTASVQQSWYGDGIGFKTASHYRSVEQVTVDGANLASNADKKDLYIGSK